MRREIEFFEKKTRDKNLFSKVYLFYFTEILQKVFNP